MSRKIKSDSERNFHVEAMDDAKIAALHFMPDIMYQIQDQMDERDGDEFPDTFQTDFNFNLEKYIQDSAYPNGDEYHHLEHVDKEYDLLEAAMILEQLDKFEETDSGLWEGLEPRRAISCQAAYTYGNAVSYCFEELLQYIEDQLNSDPILVDMLGIEDRASEGQIQGRIEELIDQYR